MTEIYSDFAQLLEYPNGHTLALALQTTKKTAALSADAAGCLDRFTEGIEKRGGGHALLEELFVSTFEIGSTTHLYLGEHLLGESGRRAELLIRLRQMQKTKGTPEGRELPDHLCVLLRLMDKLSNTEASELVHFLLLPSLQKICDVFTKGESMNPYSYVLQGLTHVLHRQFPEVVS